MTNVRLSEMTTKRLFFIVNLHNLFGKRLKVVGKSCRTRVCRGNNFKF